MIGLLLPPDPADSRGFPRARRSQAAVPAGRPPPTPHPLPASRRQRGDPRKAGLLWSPQADTLKEQELLPDFLTDVFCGILGYTRAVDSKDRYTFSREKFVEVDGKFADAVLGELTPGQGRFIVAVEGKGPKDPLDRPFVGQKMLAVDQAYRYAINLPCDWIIVTSMRQSRLYHKGSDPHTYERFDTDALAEAEGQLKRFLFLLGSLRVVPTAGQCHLYELLNASEKFGRELTKAFLPPLRRHARVRLRSPLPGEPDRGTTRGPGQHAEAP
jgi:hypothetical protein